MIVLLPKYFVAKIDVWQDNVRKKDDDEMNMNFSFSYDGIRYDADNIPVCNIGYELEPGITVTVCKKEYPRFDAVEWLLYFENKSEQNSKIFCDICDCDAVLPLRISTAPKQGYRPQSGDLCVITMNGMTEGRYYWENDKMSASEYNFNYEYLDKAPNKTKSFANRCARSSEGMMPFFDVTADGAGYIVAIGWSGDWKAEFSGLENSVNIKTGLKETCFYLKPGEKIRTSSALIMKYESDEDKHNKFRKLIRNHYSHKACTKTERNGLFAFALWGGLTSDEMKKRITDLANHGIKAEDIWIDAGWYGNCENCDDEFTGDWAIHTGEWNVNKKVHPDDLKSVAECAKNVGMKLMLWLEPERAVKGTEVTVEHPEWFLSIPDNINLILNYGNDDALAYVCQILDYYVDSLGLSCYRQDFNMPLTKYFECADEENRRGITEIKHIMGMYKVWDYILGKYPGLIIDNCSSGGRRIDIETLKRSVAFFRSDYLCNLNENPEVLQTHNTNASAYLPYIGCATKTKNDKYAVRSSYSPSWGGAFYFTKYHSMDESDFEFAKEMTDEYLSIRKYMFQNFYNHGSSVFDDTSWAIWQYHDEESQSGIIMAFRRENSPFDRVCVSLRGIDDNENYTFFNLDDKSYKNGGREIEILLPQKRSCVIYEYKILKMK